MHPPFSILAAGNADLFKVIFWIIVGTIWVIGSIASSLKKKAQQNQPRQRRVDVSELPIDLTPQMQVRPPMTMRPPPLRAAPQRFFQPVAPPPQAPLKLMPISAPSMKARPIMVAPMPQQRRVVPPRPSNAAAPTAPPARPMQQPAASAARPMIETPPAGHRESVATQLARALQRPGTLRTQIVLTEILGKPVALR